MEGGSLVLDGPFTLSPAELDAQPPRRLGEAWLCRCGRSGNKPFCDGSHSGVGR
jgi:CDGSH-type Zn-finger protein